MSDPLANRLGFSSDAADCAVEERDVTLFTRSAVTVDPIEGKPYEETPCRDDVDAVDASIPGAPETDAEDVEDDEERCD